MPSTNYYDTFIAVADDCPMVEGMQPPTRENPSVAERAYAMISRHPYELTSDDVIFGVYADRNDIAECDRPAARDVFFEANQACLRGSALCKRYGWGVHADARGRLALYGVETQSYRNFVSGRVAAADGREIKVVNAMRSSRVSA